MNDCLQVRRKAAVLQEVMATRGTSLTQEQAIARIIVATEILAERLGIGERYCLENYIRPETLAGESR